jgi:hypothetical protein
MSSLTPKNHRTYRLTEPLRGSRTGDGLIIADLYDQDDQYVRAAVVADCTTHNGALQWLRNQACKE